LILSPRWIVWHVVTLGAMVTCGWLAAWQWQRAGSAMGSALNVGYGLQWPLFAVFFGVMWWRMLRMEAATLEEAAPPAEDAVAAPVPAPRPAPSLDASSSDAPISDAPISDAPISDAAAPDAPSPFGPRPRDAAPPPVDDDPELVAYNQMLAQLAAGHPTAEGR
jgi:DNA-binding transcriptional regulator of glucitol operon